MRHELTVPAERDIRNILRHTLQTFGPRQAKAYAGITGRGIDLVSDDPDRPSSSARPELNPRVRSLHLQVAAKRQGAAAHCLYYMTGRLADGSTGVVILRVVHEHMEPRHRVIGTLGKTAESGTRRPKSDAPG